MKLTAEQAQAFQQTHLAIWCVTTNTKDFGHAFVARPIIIGQIKARQEDGYLIAPTLAELRALLPARLRRKRPNPNDDPVIVEIWM